MRERTPLMERKPRLNKAPVHTWSDQAIDADVLALERKVEELTRAGRP